VCKLSDYVGSTDFIIKTVAASAPGTRWLVGTNSISSIASPKSTSAGQGSAVHGADGVHVFDHATYRSQHLAWSLENLVAGKVVNQIQVPEREARLARVALDRMLAVS